MISIPPKAVLEPSSTSSLKLMELAQKAKDLKTINSVGKMDTDKIEKQKKFSKGSSSDFAKNFAAKQHKAREALHEPTSLEPLNEKASVTKDRLGRTENRREGGAREKLLSAALETEQVYKANEKIKSKSKSTDDRGLEQLESSYLNLFRNNFDYSRSNPNLSGR